ncbi:hypothetical protein [Gloeothece verrucosa]|uniref:Uncharacterized protein n=1 Tax=Gloeothece verrucosa (strain PCC 7822) TaxID=497965 RepID=E0UCZ4_GLOV7|nr:hypothetical protein [Gloeothece verrucosa]ADN16459.1 conserved hypothetical protein [Gloeothece verrucosa PCC 7822]
MTPQLTSKSLSKLLEKYPNLKTPIEQGRFLTGYTQGSYSGNQVNVFLVRSPWTQFCLPATAIGSLPPGAVLLITEEAHASPQGLWKAYSLETDNKSFNNRSTSQVQSQFLSSLTSTAASIAIETERKYSSRRLRELAQQQLVR